MADACVEKTQAAAAAEQEAIELDRKNKSAEAAAQYQIAMKLLEEAEKLAASAHKDDVPKLAEHRKELGDRVKYLQGLKGGQAPTIPIEDQIKAVQLGMHAADQAQGAAAAAGGVKTLGAAAACGAVGGFIVLGGILGTTIAVAGGAAGMAYAATRKDEVGDAARGLGNMTLAGASKVKEIDHEHNLTGKAKDLGSAAVSKAKEINDKHGITDKVKDGTSKAVAKAKEIEEKHNVTGKVAAGLSKGMAKATDILGGTKKQ